MSEGEGVCVRVRACVRERITSDLYDSCEIMWKCKMLVLKGTFVTPTKQPGGRGGRHSRSQAVGNVCPRSYKVICTKLYCPETTLLPYLYCQH